MSSEFTDAANEAMGTLQDLAGAVWVWQKQNLKFSAVAKTDSGSFDLMGGGSDFERGLTLICSKNDFAIGVPPKKSIVYRQASPRVLYEVMKDTSTENDIDPTFTLELKLKKG